MAGPSARPRMSVVVPVYGCEACLVELHRQLVEHLTPISPDFELILVCDGSPDDSWRVIRELGQRDPRVRGVALARNFGQHYAISAGVDRAEGDHMVVMDCDLQDAPQVIPRMHAKALEGYDVVFARRIARQDPWFKRTSSRLFYRLLAYLTDSRTDPALSNFSIVSRRVVLDLRRLGERNRNYIFFVTWLGYQQGYVDAEHQPRFAGRTTYTLGRMLRFAVETIVSSSDKPLRLSIQFGLLMALASAGYALWLVVRFYGWAAPVEGWTSTMVAIFFVAGLLFANLGILGLYIGRIFDETKKRPLYAVRATVNLPDGGAER